MFNILFFALTPIYLEMVPLRSGLTKTN